MLDKGTTSCWTPKNIQQIGKPAQGVSIYVEEYAKSFIAEISEKKCSEATVLVLTGSYRQTNDDEMIFVTGAIPVGACEEDTYIYFDDEKWREIYDCINHYFPDDEIVGWAVTGRSFDKEDKQGLKRAHVDNFGTGTRILYICNWLEKKEQFCLYSGGNMNSLTGYYIYYTRNDNMRDFMCDYENEQTGEIRQKMQKKEKEQVRVQQNKMPDAAGKLKQRVYRYAYLAGVLLAVSVLAFTYLVKQSQNTDSDENAETVNVQTGGNPFLEKLLTPTVAGFIIENDEKKSEMQEKEQDATPTLGDEEK